ncbi:aldo/keto reductase [Methylocaldum marinum]|uniref:Aldo/keto reductase n=1 Tax=Methylocaldum marinum TaxID=1432792 RepID=A0A250KUP2_9GAMM|nr:aldo/keto reductase [Methylocaldum marinum]BBA35388.1 aldo/keto reductase [Methylocaldum marinum]
MTQREINGTGIRVVPIGLGAMALSIQGRPSEEQAFQVIETFLAAGGNFIDTANVYCLDDSDTGHNERLIVKALERLGKRDRVVIATKGGLRRPGGEWVIDGDPKFLRRSCEQSLRDLKTDCIEIYQLHAVDANIGLLPSLEELIKLRDEGKIRHIGLSNVSDLDLIQAALEHVPIVSVQNRCNPFEKRDFANGVIEHCGLKGITYVPHSPVGGHYGHMRLNQSELFGRLAEKYRSSRYGIALAWLLAKGEHIIPIPGASKPASIADSLRVLQLRLDPEDIQAIDTLPELR